MSEHQSIEPGLPQTPQQQPVARREFLGHLGGWSAASIAALIGGAAWLSTSGSATAGAWVNRRHGGGWVNGGGGWVNRSGGWINGGGSWINGGGGWINGGGSWVNGGGGSWVNRRGGGGWINRR